MMKNIEFLLMLPFVLLGAFCQFIWVAFDTGRDLYVHFSSFGKGPK